MRKFFDTKGHALKYFFISRIIFFFEAFIVALAIYQKSRYTAYCRTETYLNRCVSDFYPCDWHRDSLNT